MTPASLNPFDYPALIVLMAVLFLIAVRQVGRFRFQIWHIMLLGAIAVLIAGSIGPVAAMKAINPDVMLFLFGMFVVGEALRQSGYLYQLSYRTFGRSKSVDSLILSMLVGIGILSAFLMNDTLAIICTPLMLYFARQHKVNPKLLLLTLAFAVTTGSVLSPIGSPQSLLVAIGGHVPNPFVTFFLFLAAPSMLNLVIAYGALRLFYRDNFQNGGLNHVDEPLDDPKLARLCRVSLVIVGILVAAKIVVVSFHFGFDFSLTYIAVWAAAPILILSPKRFQVLKQIDWSTLVFFAAMFVLMEAVWQTGFFQNLIEDAGLKISSLPMILSASVVVSQFVSNVPFVALFLPVLIHAGSSTVGMMALAAGSTISGNMFILGAASNVIIIQNAEKQGETVTFWEFARIGVPLTIVQIAIYWLWLALVS